MDVADIRNKLIELDLHAPSQPPLGRRAAQVGRRSLRRCLRCSAVLAVPDHARRRVVLSSSHRERPPASVVQRAQFCQLRCVCTHARALLRTSQTVACPRACLRSGQPFPSRALSARSTSLLLLRAVHSAAAVSSLAFALPTSTMVGRELIA